MSTEHISQGEDGFFHAQGVIGDDVYLCGFAEDGERGLWTAPPPTKRWQPVTCPNCVAILNYCKAFPKRLIAVELGGSS